MIRTYFTFYLNVFFNSIFWVKKTYRYSEFFFCLMNFMYKANAREKKVWFLLKFGRLRLNPELTAIPINSLVSEGELVSYRSIQFSGWPQAWDWVSTTCAGSEDQVVMLCPLYWRRLDWWDLMSLKIKQSSLLFLYLKIPPGMPSLRGHCSPGAMFWEIRLWASESIHMLGFLYLNSLQNGPGSLIQNFMVHIKLQTYFLSIKLLFPTLLLIKSFNHLITFPYYLLLNQLITQLDR